MAAVLADGHGSAAAASNFSRISCLCASLRGKSAHYTLYAHLFLSQRGRALFGVARPAVAARLAVIATLIATVGDYSRRNHLALCQPLRLVTLSTATTTVATVVSTRAKKRL